MTFRADILNICKSVFETIGRALNRYTPMQFLATGGLVTTTAMAAWLITLIVYHVPNGTGDAVPLSKVQNLAYALFGCLAIMGIGIIGLFMLAKAFGNVSATFAGNSFSVGQGQPQAPVPAPPQPQPSPAPAPVQPVQPAPPSTPSAAPPQSDQDGNELDLNDAP